MNKPQLSHFGTIAPLLTHRYERYLPTAYDESMTLLQKVNKVIKEMNRLGEITGEVFERWNQVMEWILNDGISESVLHQLKLWNEDGTLGKIINNELFGQLNSELKQNGINLAKIIKQLNDDNVYVGLDAGKYSIENHVKGTHSGNYSNVAIGMSALLSNMRGWKNTVVGHSAMKDNKGGYNNVAVGDSALEHNIGENGQVGSDASDLGSRNTALGSYALRYNKTGRGNVGVGRNAGHASESGNYNTSVGTNAYSGSVQNGDNINAKTADFNTAIGYNALFYTNGNENVGIGSHAGYRNDTGRYNTYVGSNAGRDGFNDHRNTAIGYQALTEKNTGSDNTAIGAMALANMQTVNSSTAVGDNALLFDVEGLPLESGDYVTGLGKQSRASGSFQVQLGTSGQTTYAYGAVQSRSDERDKTDIRDTELGLDFIKKLRAVDYRWDYRDDYIEFYDVEVEKEVKNPDGTTEIIKVMETKTRKLNKDGSKKRQRFHHGFIAQEVEKVIVDNKIDFGGYQDHSKNGGKDVKSIGYEEMIAPMVKAIQELSAELNLVKTELSELKSGE